MLVKKASEPFMVDSLPNAALKLRQDPPVPVPWMLVYGLTHMLHQFLIFFGEAVGTVLSIIVGAFRQIDCRKAPIQSAFFFVLIHEADLLGRGQLSPKKFFRQAISTSFLPTMRSSLAILSFFSFSSSPPPKALEPFSFTFVFQFDKVTG